MYYAVRARALFGCSGGSHEMTDIRGRDMEVPFGGFSVERAFAGAATRNAVARAKEASLQARALLPHLQPLNSLRSQRHTRHLQSFHHPIPQILLGRAVLPSPLRSQHQLRHHAQPG